MYMKIVQNIYNYIHINIYVRIYIDTHICRYRLKNDSKRTREQPSLDLHCIVSNFIFDFQFQFNLEARFSKAFSNYCQTLITAVYQRFLLLIIVDSVKQIEDD